MCYRFNRTEFLADRTVGIILSSVCLPVSLCIITLCIVALRVGDSVYRAESCTSVFLVGNFLFVPSGIFLYMYRLATKRTEKRVEENSSVSFLRQAIRRALVVLGSVIH